MADELPLSQRLIAQLPRVLVVFAIWGIAVFLWSTFGAWTQQQHISNEARILASVEPVMADWLRRQVMPLDRLARDPRILAGMELPAGVESLPVQRVLYEYSYLNGNNEIYVIDLATQRVGNPAGAIRLPEEVVSRMADIPDDAFMFMGIGQRHGKLLMVQKVNAPLPQRVVVASPVDLPTLASSLPEFVLPAERELALIVPHSTGWVSWPLGKNAFDVDPGLNDALESHSYYLKKPHMTVFRDMPGLGDVKIALQGPGTTGASSMLPQLLVALWALMMSAMVYWDQSKTYMQKARTLAAPAMQTLQKFGGPVQVTIGKIAESMRGQWQTATQDTPLVDGPGAFDQTDFVSSAELARQASLNKRPRSAVKPLALKQSPIAATPQRERRARPRGGMAEKDRKPMAWPTDKPLAQLKPRAEREKPIDKTDMRAIVEDCLRKKRIKLLYQPIYRAGDNMPIMHEVYARLVKSTGEIIPPDVFLPVATKHKMILELDVVVLRKVVHEHFGGGNQPATPLALNISSTSLDGIAYLQEMTNQGPRVLQKISFEVRSQEMIRDPKALRLLKDLQKHGGNLAVDYFGGGVAMLDASKAMGFNHVKLNCSRLMSTDAGKKELIMLCQHARGIGLPIIMEMVGDDEAERFARRAGAEFLQGYALGRPQDTLSLTPLPMDISQTASLAARPANG